MQFFQCIVMSSLLYAGEKWAVGYKNITLVAVFQMNCLRRIDGNYLRDRVPNVDILNRCNTSSVESQLQSKRLRWLGHTFRMPHDRVPKKLLFGQVNGSRPSGRPRLSYNDVAVIVMNDAILGHTRVLRTDSFGETRIVLHVPSSS